MEQSVKWNCRSYTLCAALGISLRSADTKHIHGPAIAAEEASVVVSVRVNSSDESLWRSQGKFHPVLATDLAHWKRNRVQFANGDQRERGFRGERVEKRRKDDVKLIKSKSNETNRRDYYR